MNDPNLAKIIGKSLALPGLLLMIWLGAKLWGIVRKSGKRESEVDKQILDQQKHKPVPSSSSAALERTCQRSRKVLVRHPKVTSFFIVVSLFGGLFYWASSVGDKDQQPTEPATNTPISSAQQATATPQVSQPTTDLNMLTKAAKQGDPLSQVKLGRMYQVGEGVPQDDKQAITWFRKSAEQGFGPGQFYLGRMYRDGQDYLTAYAWLSLAASEGVEDAAKHRDSAAYGFTPAQRSKAQALAAELQAKIDKQKK